MALVVVLLAACAEGDSLLSSGLEPPGGVIVTPLGQSAIKLEWTPGSVVDLEKYRIQRRVNLRGRFETVADVNPTSTVYFDTGLEPETFYGYRIVALNRVGDPSRPSVVVGVATAPRPGIRLVTALGGGTSSSVADPNGYRVVLSGARDTVVSIGTIGELVLAPLPAGQYTVTLGDILPTCRVTDDTVRTVSVADTGLATRSVVSFTATCADPTRGQIVVVAQVQGDSVDPDGYRVEYAGIIADDTVPVLGSVNLAGEGGSLTFRDLRPGDYEISLGDVESPCLGAGTLTRSVEVQPLSSDTVSFSVTCVDRGGGNPDAPFVFRNLWAPQTSTAGQVVTLDITLDGSADPSQTIGAAQAELRYDPAILTFQSASNPSTLMSNITVNSSTPGILVWGNFSTSATPPSGVVPAARFSFQVTGSSGSVVTHSTISTIADGEFSVILDTLFRVVEDTLVIGAGGGTNQTPTAQAGGPYSGTAGSAISFSSTGSSDPDGSIATYSWTFGDGATSSQANPSHSYAAAGSYTATLTVTDNQGAQATDQAAVTVASAGGGNQAPVANAGGPYSGTVGASVSFSSAGSSDPDGSIASYSWSFGDGGSSSDPNPAHAYAAAGSYTATLTVTDNLGATGSAQAAVTVTGGSNAPFAWTSSFGGFEQVLGTYPLTITLNLSSDIPETSGPEALGSYTVDSLVWDPAVLEYHSLAFGSGGGSFNTTNATGGCKCKLVFNGSPTSNTGVVTVATVRFRPVGSTGASTATKTTIGPVLSTPALGSFNYRNRIQVVEGSLSLP